PARQNFCRQGYRKHRLRQSYSAKGLRASWLGDAKMTLTRRALITQALTASAASVAAHAASTPATASPATKLPSGSLGTDAGAPAWIESDLPAAERLLGLSYRPKQRKQLARGYPAVLKELGGIRALSLPNDTSPAVRFDPRIPGETCHMPPPGVRGRTPAAGALPSSLTDVALTPAWTHAAWLRAKRISSVELTHLHLDRIGRLSPQLQNFIAVTDDLALEQAAGADADLARDRFRSGLHGVPYGLGSDQRMICRDGTDQCVDTLEEAVESCDHLCLVMKAGFLELPTRTIDNKPVDAHGAKHRVPRAICLWSALFREVVLITLGRALEAVLGVADQNPPLALR
ncbi:MAG TPA: hypothetical protein VFW10_01225, partial [Steroidobacteraceae bacterium]|nr:hypothetical protein [Steroidobacteraceae bacterium]